MLILVPNNLLNEKAFLDAAITFCAISLRFIRTTCIQPNNTDSEHSAISTIFPPLESVAKIEYRSKILSLSKEVLEMFNKYGKSLLQSKVPPPYWGRVYSRSNQESSIGSNPQDGVKDAPYTPKVPDKESDNDFAIYSNITCKLCEKAYPKYNSESTRNTIKSTDFCQQCRNSLLCARSMSVCKYVDLLNKATFSGNEDVPLRQLSDFIENCSDEYYANTLFTQFLPRYKVLTVMLAINKIVQKNSYALNITDTYLVDIGSNWWMKQKDLYFDQLRKMHFKEKYSVEAEPKSRFSYRNYMLLPIMRKAPIEFIKEYLNHEWILDTYRDGFDNVLRLVSATAASHYSIDQKAYIISFILCAYAKYIGQEPTTKQKTMIFLYSANCKIKEYALMAKLRSIFGPNSDPYYSAARFCIKFFLDPNQNLKLSSSFRKYMKIDTLGIVLTNRVLTWGHMKRNEFPGRTDLNYFCCLTL